MNNFLRTGQKVGGSGGESSANASNCTDGVNSNADCDMKMNVDQQPPSNQQQNEDGESSALTEMKMITSNQPKIAIDMDSVLKVIENAESSKNMAATSATSSLSQANRTKSGGDGSASKSQTKESHKRGAVTGPDPTKPLQPKAKLLRQQRKAEKLAAKAGASPAIATAEASSSSTAAVVAKKMPKNAEKTLKSFIGETPTDGKHKLKVNNNNNIAMIIAIL